MGTVGGSYSWNASCDVCGFQFKASELRKRWDGLIVCDKDFETRHVLDFYKNREDFHPLPFTRPQEVITSPYTGIYDNYLTSMTFSSVGAVDGHGGVGFNCLTEGYAHGIKFYVDKTSSGYGSQDNMQNYTIALYALNKRASGATTNWTLLTSQSFGPPFHNGWNERYFTFPVHLEQYHTYLLTRVYENQSVAGFPPTYTETSLGFSLFQATDTEYLQHGQYLHRASTPYNLLNPPVNLYSPSNSSKQLGLDILFVPITGAEIKDDNVGVWDINAFTPTWMRQDVSRQYEAATGVYMLFLGFIPVTNRALEGLRWFNPGSTADTVRLQLWKQTLGVWSVEWDMNSYGLALPGQWTYFPIDDYASYLNNSELYYVSIFSSSTSTFPTLNSINFSAIAGDAEVANPNVSYYENRYRTNYGAPDTASVSAFTPYLLDVVTGPTIL